MASVMFSGIELGLACTVRTKALSIRQQKLMVAVKYNQDASVCTMYFLSKMSTETYRETQKMKRSYL